MVQHHFFSATRCWKCGGCCRCGRCGLHCTRNCGRMVRLSLKSLEAVSKPEGCRLSCPFQGAVPAQVKQCPLAPLVLAASTTYLPPGQTPPTHPPPPPKNLIPLFPNHILRFPGTPVPFYWWNLHYGFEKPHLRSWICQNTGYHKNTRPGSEKSQ